jgi:hypothetical protein
MDDISLAKIRDFSISLVSKYFTVKDATKVSPAPETSIVS